VHLSFPPNTLAELITYAKTKPDKVNLATTPKGTAPYMAAQLFKVMAGVELTIVLYRGDAPALTDLLGDQVPAAFGGISAWIEHIRTGKLRALAMASAARLEMLPDVRLSQRPCPVMRRAAGPELCSQEHTERDYRQAQ
jgi:tripartite-type tricarboxylate transporter receptor subunit TctC